MTHTTAPFRLLYIDYLRAFMVLLVVFEHALLPYSPHFKNTAYIADFGGDVFFDIFHYHNDTVMMPFLFLLAGMFVIPSLKRRGYLSFAREKFFRLVIPFFVGVAVLVPPQTYCKYLVKVDPNIGYWDYLTNVYFFDKMSSSGFWFLYYLFLQTFALVMLYAIWPGIVALIGRVVNWMTSKPIRGFILFFVVTAIIFGISDLLWGPIWWVGFGGIFYLGPGSRFLIMIPFFILGVGIAEIGLSQNKDFLEKLSNSWIKWVLMGVISGALYMSYSLANFHDGAYNYEFLRHLQYGGSWDDGWSILKEYAPPVLIRTTLLGLFLCSLTVMYFSLFYRFLNKESVIWQSLAACSFGIYIFHETLQVPTTYYFYGMDISVYIKFLVVLAVSWFGSWFLVQKVFLKLPGFKRVL
jgi:peptidoglycan/LPS O-acetylase OafA/YrhL